MKKLLLFVILSYVSFTASAQVPELIYYQFDNPTTVINYATTPVGTNPAPIAGLTSATGGFLGSNALSGTGASASTNKIVTGWNTSITGSFTIGFWTSNVPASSTLYYIFGDAGASSFRCFTNGVAGANNWMIRGAGLPDLVATGAATMAPHMIHFVYNATAGTYTSYVDGVQSNQVTASTTVTATGTGLTIGGYTTSASLNGLMDEFRWYNRALSAAEVGSTYNIDLNFAGNCANAYSNVVVDSILSTSAKVSWTPGVGNSSFWLEYGLVGFTPGLGTKITGTYPGTQPPVYLTGLSVNTNYDYYLGEICNSGNDSIYPSGPSQFKTTKLCAPVTNLAVSNVGPTSADISWNHAGGAGSFTIYYGAGLSQTATSSPYTLTGLMSNTLYNNVYVVADCGTTNGLSDSTGPISFLTPCATIATYPFIENFDGAAWVVGAPGTVDQCWSRTQGTADPRWWVDANGTSSTGTGPSAANSGSNYLYLETSGGVTGSTAYLNLPAMNLTPLTVPYFSFYYHMYGATMGDLVVEVSVDTGATWTAVLTLSGQDQTANADPYKEEFVDLTTYKTAFTLIRFKGVRGTSITGDMAIDDVKMEEAPACPKPTALSVSAITASSALISYLSQGTTFSLEWGPAGFSQGTGQTGTASTNSYTMTGLASNTEYDVYVQNNCTAAGNGLSVWAGPITFKTECTPQLTVTENFDGAAVGSTTNPSAPDCWKFRKANGSGSGYGYTRALNAQSTPNSWYSSSGNNATTGDTMALISPNIGDMDVNYKQIQFSARSASTSTAYNVKWAIATMAGPGDFGSMIFIDTVTIGNNTSYQLFTVYLDTSNGYNGVHKYIALVDVSDVFDFSYVDDISITNIPLCLPPINPTSSGLSPSSGVVSWTNTGTFDIEYGPTGYTQGTGITITGATNPDTLTGLFSNTCYDVYVRQNCGSGSYSPWVLTTFCTPCSTVTTYPFTENFDGPSWLTTPTPGIVDQCWSRTQGTSDPRWWVDANGTSSSGTGPSAANSGSNYLYLETSGGVTGSTAYLNLPAMDLTPLNAPYFSFYYHMYGATMGSLIVEASVDTGATWTAVLTLSGQDQTANSDPFKQEFIGLGAYKTAYTLIRFKGVRGTSFTGDMAIDDVRMAEAPLCPDPQSLVVSGITGSTATIGWTTLGANQLQFVVEYGPQGFGQGSGAMDTVSTASALLSGLNPITCYDAYVMALCGANGTSVWVGPVSFCTQLTLDVSFDDLIITPAGCGDSTTTVRAVVKNNGVNTVSSIPITVNITGGITQILSFTSTTSMIQGATDTVLVGSINTYAGAAGVMFEGYASLVGDLISTNDTLTVGPSNFIPVIPQHYPVDTVCANADSATFAALNFPGVEYGWFANATDTVPAADGDSLTFAVNGQQTWYLGYTGSGEQTLTTAYAGGNSCGGGVMFNITANKNINITGFNVSTTLSAGSAVPLTVYYIPNGTYLGNQLNASAWTTHGSTTATSAGLGNATTEVLPTSLMIPAGATYAIYLNYASAYTNGNGTNQVVSNPDMTLNLGIGMCGLFTGANNPRIFNGGVIYGGQSCSNIKVPMTLGVNTDTAAASFTSTVQANGADVDFDGTASLGQVYTWDFGDGSAGSGATVTHTYATGGTWTACLVVEDTVCGSSDTICKTVITKIGVEESLLNTSLIVFPNPNNGNFRVEFQVEGLMNIEMRLTTLLGQEIYASKPGNISGEYRQDIDLSNQAAGVYILQIISDSNIVSRRITIRK